MNVVQLLFTLRLGRHSPAEALVGLGLRVAKSGRFPFLCFLLSPSNGPARFIAGADTPKPERSAQHNVHLWQPGASKIWMAYGHDAWFANMSRKLTS